MGLQVGGPDRRSGMQRILCVLVVLALTGCTDGIEGDNTDTLPSDTLSSDASDTVESDTSEATDSSSEDASAEAMMPDFELVDVNPNSASFELSVSPRDHLGQVSAFYFTHAT